MSPIDVHAIAERVRSEFNEMPGLRLTARQAAKRLGVSLRTLFYKMDRYGIE